MKKNVLFFFFVILFPLVAYSSGNDAVANPAAVVEEGDVRFTVLTPRVIRMEWDSLHRFTDERSFIVINRNLPVPEFKKIIRGGKLTIRTDELELTYKLNTGKFSKENLEIKYLNKKRAFTWNPSVTQKQNLKGTARTLDRMDGTTFIKRNEPRHELQLEDGILSRDGWTLINDSSGLLFDNSDFSWVKERENRTVQDWYFMAYGSDYKAALKDFTLFAGKVPLPPRFVFGYWWSRYWAYSDNEMRDVVSQFEKFNIPLDVLVVDMDWHETDSLFAKPDKWGQRKHWTGYTWEKRLFPDPDQFFDWAKSKHLKTTLNLHPASGIAPFESQYKDFAKRMNFDISTHENIPWQGSNKKFMSTLFDVVLHPIEQQGVDFWWLDWQQWVFDKDIEKLNNTWWLNYTFFEDMERNTDKRPLIYHRWGGLGNHRYQIGFSGDAYITWNTLEYQPYFTNTASNVLYGYWSHDIGGHKFIEDDNIYQFDPEMYVRWVQYGALSPILRTHSNKDPSLVKEIWRYRDEYFDALYNAVRLRYQLVPYIYTMARETYETGVSLCRPMYYDYPEADEAYRYEGQYMFGNDILVAPVTSSDKGTNVSEKDIWLPEGKWYEVMTGELIDGGSVVTRSFTREQIPYYYREGAIIPLYPRMMHLKKRPETLTLQFTPGVRGEFNYYEDAGNNADYETACTFTRITQNTEDGRTSCTIYPRTGSFDDMPEERAYRLEFLARNEAPTKVTFSDGTHAVYEYDAEGKKIVISVPKRACSSAITVIIE
jgi:alpha-glucosidase (family GH31 glycosyl hydrolase)